MADQNAQATAVAPSVSPCIRVTNLVKRFGGVTAVNGVGFELPQGERMAVIGPNGAGKTTLFKMIAGEIPPTEGEIELFGSNVRSVPLHRRAAMGVARTFQVSNLLHSLTVLDNVRVAAQAGTRTSKTFWRPQSDHDLSTRQAREILAAVEMDHREKATVSDLSHGEQRQLEIAMALVKTPRLLLLDEPAAGLSARERVVLRRLVEGLSREMSFVLIEHDMNIALELVDRVLVMDNGRPIAMGLPDEIRANEQVQHIYLGRGER